MDSPTRTYINNLLLELATGNALEHSYRPALKAYIQSLDPKVTAVNEPSRSTHGAPDFAFYKTKNNNLVLGYVETKDIDVNLDQIEKTEQLRRYLGYANLILTNYIEFRFFRNGVKYQTIAIAKRTGSVISPLEQHYNQLELEVKAFLEGNPETITNAKRLAEIMGGKAARIRENVNKYLQEDADKNKELLRIYEVMRKLLVHDLSIEKFADMYAQTLVYGLFVARYYDETPENFTRQEARDLIPASNPFLQHFFDHIAGASFDTRLKYIVDELCDVFAVSAVRETVTQHYNLFGEAVDKDPVIHFYEDFLKEYDPALRKSMGAYYTPVPIVQFIIRAVDDILKSEFGLSKGLADTSKIEQAFMQQGLKAKRIIHKVQFLDPAVGTATFLNESVKFLYEGFKGQEGVWKSYVENELLPRMYGFELMMAPYTIAHLKLAMTLRETGVDHFEKRLGVYLTNTLEEGIPAQTDLFTSLGLAGAISEEAHAASEVKQHTPIMVIIGNPPYSVSSSNKSPWIEEKMKVYKTGLNERNIQPLSDDYIKFLRFAEYCIEKNGSGIVAMITNNSFIEGIIHRQMRKHLLETFDDIYILDLHGNAKKNETAPDGGKDENVFDIQQGVSINILVRKPEHKKTLGIIHHTEVYGKRLDKFGFLNKNSIESIQWETLSYNEQNYFFVPKNFSLAEEYEKGFKIDELFKIYTSGIKTHRDYFAINLDNELLYKKIIDLRNDLLSDNDIRNKYDLQDTSSFHLSKARSGVRLEDVKSLIKEITYRPFDTRWIYYSPFIVERDRREVMFSLYKKNVALITKRGVDVPGLAYVSKSIFEIRAFSNPGSQGTDYGFPLYIYFENGNSHNLNDKIYNGILKQIGDATPEDIFDYIYAVLHSPSYREKYKEFLKIDFPRIPYPKDRETFERLVILGANLRKLHLLEDPELSNFITTYPISGDNLIEKVEYVHGNVFINELQFFGNVPKETWDFYIGGYQPAQKWLKDRKGRKLTYEDITHYQKMIKALFETGNTMKEID